MSECNSNTLAAIVDEYLATRLIDKKKNYVAYLIIAKRAWQKVFRNTIWQTQSVWQEIKKGTPYNYIDTPASMERLFSVSVEDHHKLIQPLFYNTQLNIIPKPTTTTCGCSCGCDGLCEDLSSMVVTTTLAFTINGINYYTKEWIKSCPNGDLIKWREVPTKKYKDFVGQSGDYNNDFNSDYSIQTGATANFEIVTQTFQEKICQLSVKDCGCPIYNQDNIELINGCCGGFFPFGFWNRHREHRPTFLSDINSNGYGQVKMSECGTKIYFIPDPKCWDIPDYYPTHLLVNFQTNGLSCSDQVLVPDIAYDYMQAEIDYRAKRFNSKYSLGEKQQAKFERNEEQNNLILMLNPLNLQEIANIQDGPILF